MKKVLVFLLTMAMLVSTVSYAAMVIPSETSPNPLSEINVTDDNFYGQLDITTTELDTDGKIPNGATTSTKLYKNYLVVASVFDKLLNNERNRISVYDLSDNNPYLFVDWTLAEMGIPYYPTSDTDDTPAAEANQPIIYAIEVDDEYIYAAIKNFAAGKNMMSLYIFTNPLNGEIEYDENGEPVIETPRLVGGPVDIGNQGVALIKNNLPVLKKVGNSLVYAEMGLLKIGNGAFGYFDLSDIENPVKKAYDGVQLFAYTDDETGETVYLDGSTSAILGVTFDGTIGYITVSHNAGPNDYTTAHLFKIDFKHIDNPILLDELTLETGATQGSYQYPATIPVNLTGGYIYLSPLNGKSSAYLGFHFWKIDPETFEILDYIKEESQNISGMRYYDTGDMLLGVNNKVYGTGFKAIRFGEKDPETGYTTTTVQAISQVEAQQAKKVLDAFIYEIIPFGTKLYLPYGLGGSTAQNEYRQATVGYVDIAQFGPINLTINPIPYVVYDSCTISGFVTIPATASGAGVHLYINGSEEPVDAELIYDPFNPTTDVVSWEYTIEGAGVYNVKAVAYDSFGDFDSVYEDVNFRIKSTTGINAETSYSVLGTEPASTIPETNTLITAGGIWPETWVTGYGEAGGRLAVAMTNRSVPLTTTSDNNTAEKNEDGSYVIVEDNVKARNQLVFYNLNKDGSIGTVAKAYDGVDLQMSTTITMNQPKQYINNATIYGMMMDDDYVYCYVTEPRADHTYTNYYLYIYENPYNAATDSFADEIALVGKVKVSDGNVRNTSGITGTMGAYSDIQRISVSGEEYICIVDQYNTLYYVVNITDVSAPVVEVRENPLGFTYNNVTLTSFGDMEFDGNYAYISGQNDGVITEASEDGTVDASIAGAYYAVIKVDFSNPLAPTAVKSWKLCDGEFEHLNRDGSTHSSYTSSTKLRPVTTLDISGGKVIATLSCNMEQYFSTGISEFLGALKAYVLDGDTPTELSAAGFTTNANIAGLNMKHLRGSEHVYYINGTYLAEAYNPTDSGRGGNIYVVGTEENIEENAATAGKYSYHKSLANGARLLSAYEIDGVLYTSYYIHSDATYGALGSMDFNNIYPYIAKVRVEGANTYFTNIELENNSAEDVDFTPIAALYKNDILVDVMVGDTVTVDKNTTTTEMLSVDVPNDTDYSDYIIKTYVFESMSNIMPHANAMSIND